MNKLHVRQSNNLLRMRTVVFLMLVLSSVTAIAQEPAEMPAAPSQSAGSSQNVKPQTSEQIMISKVEFVYYYKIMNTTVTPTPDNVIAVIQTNAKMKSGKFPIKLDNCLFQYTTSDAKTGSVSAFAVGNEDTLIDGQKMQVWIVGAPNAGMQSYINGVAVDGKVLNGIVPPGQNISGLTIVAMLSKNVTFFTFSIKEFAFVSEPIQLKADVNAKSNNGWTALMWASNDGRSDIVRMLIDAGADVNVKSNNGYTALLLAVSSNDTASVRMLIDAKADVNAKDSNGYTALMTASLFANKEKVRLLLNAKADVNAKTNDGRTALMHAASVGHNDIVRMLIDAGADVNAKDIKEMTALMLAVSRDNATVRMLIDAGADVNARDNNGRTALMLAIPHNFTPTATIRMLIDAKADVNAKDNSGRTALMLAQQQGKMVPHSIKNNFVQMLKDAGAR